MFSGELQMLSTRTSVGEVGILAEHIPMVARLVPAELRLHKSDSEVETLRPGRGLARGVRQPRPGADRRGESPRRARRLRAASSRLEEAEQRL